MVFVDDAHGKPQGEALRKNRHEKPAPERRKRQGREPLPGALRDRAGFLPSRAEKNAEKFVHLLRVPFKNDAHSRAKSFNARFGTQANFEGSQIVSARLTGARQVA